VKILKNAQVTDLFNHIHPIFPNTSSQHISVCQGGIPIGVIN